MIEQALPAIIVISLLFALYSLFMKGGDVNGADARRLVQAGARLIDVRTPGEFAAGHLPGASNLPLQELAGRLGELGAKDSPIVLYCRSGARSASAARSLKTAGFAAVRNLGGMGRW